LLAVDSQDYLAQITDDNRPDVIYLDPMFPDRQKSADVKKEMAAFHHVVGKDEDADSLLEKALAKANYRVVVKRPRKAPFINNKTPSYQLEGKSSRYDIYTIKKMPEGLGV
jgi:16S rRNA (guanine1516-N2)-methyltransferase